VETRGGLYGGLDFSHGFDAAFTKLLNHLGDSVVSVIAHGPKGLGFDAHSRCVPVAQRGVAVGTANNCDLGQILGRLFTRHGDLGQILGRLFTRHGGA